MDAGSLVPVLALLVAAVVIAALLLRIMRKRVYPRVAPPPLRAKPEAPLTAEEEEYLDSSHIIARPGGADKRK
jgi:hypothetical protein